MPHLGNANKKANQKIHTLSTKKRYVGFEQNKLMSSFIKSKFWGSSPTSMDVLPDNRYELVE